MKNPMIYNGYSAIIEFDNECESFRGEVLDINDTITFYAKSVDELKLAMKEAIDDYLEHCSEIGKKPEKPYSGKISLRMKTELHKKTSNAATMRNKSINSFIIECIEKEIL
jgi:predicted HicB family RNase H-like nuclease